MWLQCGELCQQTTAFNCRSYTWLPSARSCRLAADDAVSAGPGAAVARQGAALYQRGPCLQRE